jgi:hypothetical protein
VILEPARSASRERRVLFRRSRRRTMTNYPVASRLARGFCVCVWGGGVCNIVFCVDRAQVETLQTWISGPRDHHMDTRGVRLVSINTAPHTRKHTNTYSSRWHLISSSLRLSTESLARTSRVTTALRSSQYVCLRVCGWFLYVALEKSCYGR